MSETIILNCASAFALFLLALRNLHRALDQTVAIKIQPLLRKVQKNARNPAMVGFLSTVLLQASSITIYFAMTFINRGFLRLETGLIVMLGAALGTTLKFWFFSLPAPEIGVILFVISSFTLLIARNYYVRKTLQVTLSIGLMYLSWHLIFTAIQHESAQTLISKLADNSLGTNLNYHITLFVAGIILAGVSQSGSTIIFVVIAFSTIGYVSFLSGTVVILGANIGTALPLMVASLEYRSSTKRLALSYVLVRVIGSVMAFLFLRAFLQFTDLIFFSFWTTAPIAAKLAGVHTCLNLINAAFWIPMLPVLIKLTVFFIPKKSEDLSLWQNTSVQTLLSHVPKQALSELKKQKINMLLNLKAYQDSIIEKLEGTRQEASINRQNFDRDILENHITSMNRLIEDISRNSGVVSDVGKIFLVTFKSQLIYESLKKVDVGISQVSDKKLNFLRPHFKLFVEDIVQVLNYRWNDVLKIHTDSPSKSRMLNEQELINVYANVPQKYQESARICFGALKNLYEIELRLRDLQLYFKKEEASCSLSNSPRFIGHGMREVSA